MPTVEIDEEVLKRLQKKESFVDALWANADARRKVLEGQKIIKPDDPAVKELDKVDPIQEALAAQRKEFEEYKKAQEEREAKREQDATLARLTAQRDDGIATLRRQGWTDKGIEGVQKIMQDKGILDPLDAAAIWEKANPPATPISPVGSQSWNFSDAITGSGDNEDYVKKLFDSKGDNDLISEKKAHETLLEIRGGR